MQALIDKLVANALRTMIPAAVGAAGAWLAANYTALHHTFCAIGSQ